MQRCISVWCLPLFVSHCISLLLGCSTKNLNEKARQETAQACVLFIPWPLELTSYDFQYKLTLGELRNIWRMHFLPGHSLTFVSETRLKLKTPTLVEPQTPAGAYKSGASTPSSAHSLRSSSLTATYQCNRHGQRRSVRVNVWPLTPPTEAAPAAVGFISWCFKLVTRNTCSSHVDPDLLVAHMLIKMVNLTFSPRREQMKKDREKQHQ